MQKQQGGFLVVARWMEKDTLKGFLLADTSHSLHMVPLDVIQQRGYMIPYLNAQYDAQFQTLVGTNGASLSNYPAVNEDYVLLKGNGIIIMSTVLDANTKKPIGVVAFNGIGARFRLTYRKLEDLMRRYPACNFTMVSDPQYGNIAVKKDGSHFDYVEVERPKVQKKGETPVSISSPGSIPVLGVYNMDEIKSSEFGQACQEKLVLAMLNMSKLTPYYYTVLQAIPRKPAPLGTMGVTEDTLYYDPKFVANLQVAELTFVLIHEILHIAMQHSIRFGSRTSHDLWNIAADLYINSIICRDFDVKFAGGVRSYDGEGKNGKTTAVIKTPDFGVYIETIGEQIDFRTDTPETIYARLMKENNNGIPQGGGGQSGGSNGQQGGQQGQQGGQSGQGGLDGDFAKAIEDAINEGMQQIREGMQRAQQQCNNNMASQQAGSQIQQGLQALEDVNNNGQQGSQSGLDAMQQGLQDIQNGINNMNDALKNAPQANQPQNGPQGSQGQQNGPQGQQQSQQQNGQQSGSHGQPQNQQGNSGNPQGNGQGQQGGQQGNQGGSSGGLTPQEQMQRGLSQIQQALSQALSAMEQAVANAISNAMSGAGQQGQGQGQQGQGQGQGHGQGQGQGSGGGQQGQSNGPVQSKSQSQQGQGQGQGSNQQSDLTQDDFQGDSTYSPMKEVRVIYNGKELKGTMMRDVMASSDSQKKEDIQKKVDASRKALQAISTKLKMEEESNGGEPLVKNAGAGGHLTQRYIEVGLAAGVDWRVLCKNICKDDPKKMYSLGHPNRRYMNMGRTVASRVPLGAPTRLSNIKFAIDVSGSVSEKELQAMLSEIANIFNHFNVDGELIYWSTMIGDAGPCSSLKEMLKVSPDTTGGTDVRCVFDYLIGNTKVHGKVEEDKPRDIKAIFIVTDGCFSNNYSDFDKVFGRKVVWLITGPKGNTITFDPPFGRVLALDIDND